MNSLELLEELMNKLQQDSDMQLPPNAVKIYFKGYSLDEENASLIKDINASFFNDFNTQALKESFLIIDTVPVVKDITDCKARYMLDGVLYNLNHKGVQYTFNVIKKAVMDSKEINRNSLRIDEGYDKVRDYLIVRLRNNKLHYGRIKDCVRKEVCDFSLCLYLTVQSGFDTVSTTPITRDIFESWNLGMSEPEIIERTLTDLKESHPALILVDPMYSFSTKALLTQGIDLRTLDAKNPLHVKSFSILTTNPPINGATSLFYPGVLDKLGLLLGGSFCVTIACSSEVYVERGTKKRAKRLISTLNGMRKTVAPDDIVTDYILYYDARRKVLERVY